MDINFKLYFAFLLFSIVEKFSLLRASSRYIRNFKCCRLVVVVCCRLANKFLMPAACILFCVQCGRIHVSFVFWWAAAAVAWLVFLSVFGKFRLWICVKIVESFAGKLGKVAGEFKIRGDLDYATAFVCESFEDDSSLTRDRPRDGPSRNECNGARAYAGRAQKGAGRV